ncbi:M3 family oligoendopeptidase [Desulfobulbus alkaliphilus]|uniref:M3 family oligoendopeptidase n=1 Tax=Desulfobulbus alkaliphilus TaxID=869814 RepID=UPI001962B3B0|nr:M3 family oligoendopeptidase [Desulfobulbus alkaliphilus]MBM9536450.1 M3 family oligoendopeptidase [Desulfobulbus alkaliphilus]
MTNDTNLHLATATVLWDLQPLYSGPDVPEIQHDMTRCLEWAEDLSAGLSGQVAHLESAAIAQAVERLESIDSLVARLSAYAFLNFITQTGNATASALLQQVEELAARVGRLTIFFRLEWNRLGEEMVTRHLEQPVLRHYGHYLRTMRQFAPHQLGTAEEELLQELRPVGRSAWNLLFEKLFGQMRFGDRRRTEEEVLSDLHHGDRAIRKSSAAELTEGLRSNLHILAHIFNTLAAEKAIDDRLRCYPAWDSAINLANELSTRTVETLVETVISRYGLVHRYYAVKKQLLGYNELFDYDRYAPIPGGDTALVPWGHCRDLILEAFADFAPEMATIAEEFFIGKRIHAPILHGKRGGAFAHPCVPDVQPYVLVNYAGTPRDVATVAHELGHGVHQVLAAEQGFYNSDTPLVLAETASVFAELLVFKAQLREMEAMDARRVFICQKLESIFATVFRQVAMNRFEAAMHNARREQGELSAEHLSAFWLATQQPMFGDSVTLTEDYGIWWSYIPHFLGTPGYVYAYAFGELLVLSLYGRYQKEGKDFVDRYWQLLRAGGNGSPYELLRPLGIDLDDPIFWLEGLKVIEQMLCDIEQSLTKDGSG